MKKLIIASLIAILLGLGFAVYGIIGLNSDEVTCGGSTMQRGDICRVTSKGGSTERATYDERRSYNQRINIIALAVGGVFTLLTVAGAIRGLKKAKSAPAAPPQGSYPPQNYQQP